MRLLVRDPARAPELPGAEIVRADYGDPDSLAAALQPGDRVFMVSVHEGPERRMPLHRSFVEGAARDGVAQVVYLSFLNAGPDSGIHARSRTARPSACSRIGLPWTAIRNGMYADHIPGWFDPDGVAERRSARPDELLLPSRARQGDRGHTAEPGQRRCPTSPRRRPSLAELAELAAEVTGRPYRYEPAPRGMGRALACARPRRGGSSRAPRQLLEAMRNGEFDLVTDDYKRLTGEDPLTIRELLELAHRRPAAALDG